MTDELREKFEAWLDENHLFDTANFIEPKADRERAKENNLVWLAYKAAHEELQGEIDALRKDVRRDAFEDGAQVIRYYLKHQNYPYYDDATEYQKGAIIACENLKELMLNKAETIDQAIAKGE